MRKLASKAWCWEMYPPKDADEKRRISRAYRKILSDALKKSPFRRRPSPQAQRKEG